MITNTNCIVVVGGINHPKAGSQPSKCRDQFGTRHLQFLNSSVLSEGTLYRNEAPTTAAKVKMAAEATGHEEQAAATAGDRVVAVGEEATAGHEEAATAAQVEESSSRNCPSTCIMR